MARKKHIKRTASQERALQNAKIDAGARRKAAVAAGEYDGRFRKRVVPSGKEYNRARSKREWKE